jgi:hypothetical protein
MGTPGDIIDLLYREIARAVASPDVKKNGGNRLRAGCRAAR